MADPRMPSQIHPGKGLGWITLGGSLHSILTRLKSQPQLYPTLDLSYSSSEPLQCPVILNLKANGIRLRFDGPDQRLRLIEVLDFSQLTLTYKNVELVRRAKSGEAPGDLEINGHGPSFRHVYNRLFGPSYPGEYIAPNPGFSTGTYVLSYPGVAFSFPLKHKAWSENADFVTLLSSSSASTASSMAIFIGSSWPESRETLFVKAPSFPRSLSLSSRNPDTVPDEIEEVGIYGAGRLEFFRRTLPSVVITLSETTPQDLVAEFGPPDAIYRKNDRRISIHASSGASATGRQSRSPIGRPHSTDAEHSSAQSHTEESDSEMPSNLSNDQYVVNAECFYNYFHHGFDALISYPTEKSPAFPNSENGSASTELSGSHLVITKILLHANIPGSYPFNRHRRSRWTIRTGNSPSNPSLTSEMPFSEISKTLENIWHNSYTNAEEEKAMRRGMVLNRGWGESPESSIELLGGFEETANTWRPPEMTDTLPSLNNTELFGFPGLLFEVLKNGAGIGLWSIDVADYYRSAVVTGVDIAPIQPTYVPPNCTFEIDDIQVSPWQRSSNTATMIFGRDLLLFVDDWPSLIREMFGHPKPGGWAELQSVLPLTKCKDGSTPDSSGFKRGCELLLDASKEWGTPLDCALHFEEHFKTTGFINIQTKVLPIPSSEWARDPRLKEIGLMQTINVCEGASAFGLRILSEKRGWSEEKIQEELFSFRQDVKTRKYHQYCEFHEVYAQKLPITMEDSMCSP